MIERSFFNPPDMIESNPGTPVFTLEYVKSIPTKKITEIFYIKRETSLILTGNIFLNYYRWIFFEFAQSDSKSNFIEYTMDFEFVHIANGSVGEFAFFVKNNNSASSFRIKHK